tara:strand:- start:1351 stop:2259 length:909 start_codon:yes stop_codon:yes gene_type:complete
MSDEDIKQTEENAQSEEIEVEIESEQKQDTAEKSVSVAQPESESESEPESEEELDTYSKGVKKRINKLTEKYRRAERDGQEAIELAKKLRDENENLRKQMTSSQEAHLSEFGQRLENDVNLAKQAYKQAHDEGDVDRMFEAQQALSRISIDQERHRLGVKRQEAQQQPEVAPSPEPQPQPQVQPDPKAVAWAEKNKWFGDDDRMTREAMRINEDLTQYEGFDASSDEYYDEINRRMQERFPDYFKKTGRSTKVAPADTSASRKPSGRSSVKLTPSEVETAKKLNVTLEQYAKEKARLMAREN